MSKFKDLSHKYGYTRSAQIAFACVCLLFLLPLRVFANDAPQTITLDGQLFDSLSVDTPLVDPSVVVDIKIYDPAKTCVLYEESQNISTTVTNGRFNLQVGSITTDTKRASGDPHNAMALIFQNHSVIPGSCGTYTPAAGDKRYLRITVSPSTTGMVEVLGPDSIIDSVPSALVAETLDGLDRDHVLQTQTVTNLTQVNAETVFSNTNYPKLISLLAGTSGSYVSIGSDGGATIPSLPAAPASPVSGQMWFDSSGHSLNYFDGTSVKVVGVTGTGTAGTVTMITAGTGLTGGSITTSGTISITNAGVGTAQIADGSVTATKLDPLINIATSGNISASNLSSNADVTRLLQFYASGSAVNYVGLRAPASLAAPYTLNLPGSGGVSGYVLATDGSGNLSWAPSAAGSLTSLNGLTTAVQTFAVPGTTGLAPAWASSGAAHTLNIPYASGTGVTGGLLNNTDYQSFAGKLSATLGAGQIYVGSSGGVATAVIATGDITISSSGLTTLTAIRGKAIDTVLPSITGQVLRWDNTSLKWSPALLTLADVQAVGGRISVSGCDVYSEPGAQLGITI